MMFAEAAAIIEGEISSHIAEMIEELTQPEGSEVPKISAEVVHVILTAVAGDPLSRETCRGICRRFIISNSSTW